MTLDLAMTSYDAKGTATKKEVDKLDFIKVESFCASKDSINKMKRRPTEWEKIFASHVSDKGLISKKYVFKNSHH